VEIIRLLGYETDSRLFKTCRVGTLKLMLAPLWLGNDLKSFLRVGLHD
jgi:hypothetical protein